MKLIIFLCIISVTATFAQGVDRSPSGKDQLYKSYQDREEAAKKSYLKNISVRHVGPVVQGGRITDIDVIDPTHYYIAFASGGLWETKDRGITFHPVFDEQGALGIGDFAVAPSDPDIIYVGTGENNSSRSSYAGTGIYKSSDGGKSWKFIGLPETQHIGRVLIHPENPDVVWVASMGALYSHNDERGVYKSSDGGETWSKTLFINDSTGIIDLIANPNNADELWAAAWERTRKAWHFKGNGPGSGIYRSTDGGETWTKSMNGFPQGSHVGRIGLAVAHTNPSILYALLDNQEEEKVENERDKEDTGLTLVEFRDMTVQHLLSIDDESLDKFLDDQGFPEKYTAKKIKAEIREGKYMPNDIADYFGDANEALFTTNVKGAELYKSEDGGKSWNLVNSYKLDGVYFTYGYYFGEVRVDPNDENKIYIFGVPLLKSSDGGKTYARIDTVGNVHVDHHTLWVDPENSKHILLGNDGGLYESYDEGANWHHMNTIPAGQFYTVSYDMQKPYNIYGGLQDNGSLVGSSRTILNRSDYWDNVFGGDGMYIFPDPRNNDIVYSGFQFGNYYRIDREKGKYDGITPKHDIGEDQLRFNWRTPLIMSNHNPDILYIGAQKVYRSFNRGDDWESVSGDLTYNYPQGNVPYSTISSLAESPMKFGLLYAGTDDGKIHRTDAAGGVWTEITGDLPSNLWVSSIYPSAHDVDKVYVSLNGYRYDDFNTYVYVSENRGRTWKSIEGNLPKGVVNVIIEDPVKEDLLYLGSDLGTFVSMDGGENWQLLNSALNVPSYDLKVHPRDHELIIGTHGRSVMTVDVKPFQQLDINQRIQIFPVSAIRYSSRWGERRYPYLEAYEPQTTFSFFVREKGEVQLSVLNSDNEEIRKMTIDAEAGFNKITWDLKGMKGKKKKDQKVDYVGPGTYKVVVVKGEGRSETDLEIKD